MRTTDPLARSCLSGRFQLAELLGVPADDQHHPVRGRPWRRDELGDLGDQGGRQVVDDEPAEVLEGGPRLRAARA